MNKLLILLSAGIFICSCGNSSESENTNQENKCDCLTDYEIMYIKPEQVEPTITCLEDQGVVLSLEHESTQELITELDPICPKESRKLWKLCKNIDEGIITNP